MTSVVIVGASGFGRETLDVLEAMIAAGSDVEIAGVLDDGPSNINLERLADRGISYLGRIDDWIAHADVSVQYLVAIGNPVIRQMLCAKFDLAGFEPFTAIHPTAIIGSRFVTGAGSVVCSGAVISTNVQLGKHVHVNPVATIGHDSILQDYVSINPASVISGEVLVESYTLVGAKSIVLQGLTISEKCTIGAGAVVTKNVPSSKVAVGVPARWS
ncbi:acetyltransferase [Corynebacterium kalinowskii]|nr:acetyltransferase [Corynebacterium kalinowskii]